MRRIFLNAAVVCVTFSILSACGGDAARYEQVRKLRGIGVEVNPVVVKLNGEDETVPVTLTVHALLPAGQEVDVEIFEDDENIVTPNAPGLKLIENSAQYEDFDKLRHYTVQGTFTVPSKKALRLKERNGVVKLRYGFFLKSGDEEEKMVGKVTVLDASSEEGKKTWKQPVLDITVPKPGDTIALNAEIDIKADIADRNDEEYKIGWFVSNGEIENRRARETKWKTSGDAKHLLVGTIRGKRSYAFNYKIIEFSAK